MKLRINSEDVEVSDDLADVPLVSVLRDHLRLTGTKFGCGIGMCGACTVHVDGYATRSCVMFTADAVGTEITTIEGLADTHPGQGLHPVQGAWIAETVPQCGYCQAGQIMNAAALLTANPAPSAEDIRDEMDGNLCRCGTYGRIRKAIERAAREMQK
jgi:isoquinoline 1-oxidoreductase alpha subunit